MARTGAAVCRDALGVAGCQMRAGAGLCQVDLAALMPILCTIDIAHERSLVGLRTRSGLQRQRVGGNYRLQQLEACTISHTLAISARIGNGASRDAGRELVT